MSASAPAAATTERRARGTRALCTGLVLTMLACAAAPAAEPGAARAAKIPERVIDSRTTAPRAHAPERVLVRFDAMHAAAASLAALGPRASVEEIVSMRPPRVLLRVAPARAAQATAASLSAMPGVAFAVHERYYAMELRSRYAPNDPLLARQWHLENTGQGGRISDADVDAPEAWAVTRGSADIVIAVLDDGVELSHPDLAPNIVSAGRDFTTLPAEGDAAPKAGADRHGTAVAGVAAARGDNGRGVAGICPRCSILPVRVHGSSNLGTAAAFRYAVEQGADVITNSWGYRRGTDAATDAAVRDAIEQAAREGRGGRGIPIFFGMTNEPVDNCRAPALDISSLDSVIAVGVSDHNDELGGSGYGECMDLVAPSKPKYRSTIGITTTDRTGLAGHVSGAYHASFGGTSAAAPLAAGIAGLLLSLNPELTATEVRRILERTADKIAPEAARYDARGFSPLAGHGRVNAASAVVPHATLRIEPDVVVAGEPFDVVVTASAPFGLESVAWSGRATGQPALDERRLASVDGSPTRSMRWSGIVVDAPGIYELEAEARARPPSRDVAGYARAATVTASLNVEARR